jgi:four helix bundle protein
MSGTYRDLFVWQKSMHLVFRIYEATQRFPKHELYGLVSQMRRAAVSIPSNVAEGKGRSSDRDFSLFLQHSRGSLHELETQILISEHLGYVTDEEAADLQKLTSEVGRLLMGLMSFAASARNPKPRA